MDLDAIRERLEVMVNAELPSVERMAAVADIAALLEEVERLRRLNDDNYEHAMTALRDCRDAWAQVVGYKKLLDSRHKTG